MLNTLPRFEIKGEFELDTYAWFTKRLHGHMGRWQYMEPQSQGDAVCGAMLWDVWEKEASQGDNMLKRQSDIIESSLHEMHALIQSHNCVIDLGPGGLSAVERNTLPFINNDIEKYIAIDICKDAAINAQKYIEKKSQVKSLGIHNDFFEIHSALTENTNAVALMMGGTVGNFEAIPNTSNPIQLMSERLKKLGNALPKNTISFIGLEATQNSQILYDSYDYESHAAYEINVMHAIKRDLLQEEDGFDPYAWKYSMQWYPEAHQFCHIAESTALQRFSMYGEDFRFAKGDQLVIDNSFKFPVLSMQRAAQLAGAEYLKPFSDSDGRMVIHAIRFC